MLESKRIPCSALAVHKNITQSLTKSDYEKSFIGPHMEKVDNLIFAILSNVVARNILLCIKYILPVTRTSCNGLNPSTVPAMMFCTV